MTNVNKMLYTIRGEEVEYKEWVDCFIYHLLRDTQRKESGNTREIFERQKSEFYQKTKGIDYMSYEKWLEDYAYVILDSFIEYENNVNGVILKVENRKEK